MGEPEQRPQASAQEVEYGKRKGPFASAAMGKAYVTWDFPLLR